LHDDAFGVKKNMHIPNIRYTRLCFEHFVNVSLDSTMQVKRIAEK